MSSTKQGGNSLLEGIDAPTRKRDSGSASGSSVDKKKFVAISLTALSVVVLAFTIWSTVRSYQNDPKRLARLNTLMDAETKEVFLQFPLEGTGFPQVNPKTGKRTLYPAEACYWTKDGKAKLEPTYVVLGTWFGDRNPTKCPDCGRIVTKSNRMPPDALMQQAWDAAESAKKR